MRIKTMTAAILSLLMLASMSGAVVAGRATVYYGGGIQPVSAHRYAFVPDTQLQKTLSPTPKDVTKQNMAITGGKPAGETTYKWGTRYAYRTTSQIQAKQPGKITWSTSGKLSTTWPKTIYNQNIGQGRELSRIFK